MAGTSPDNTERNCERGSLGQFVSGHIIKPQVSPLLSLAQHMIIITIRPIHVGLAVKTAYSLGAMYTPELILMGFIYPVSSHTM